MQHDILSRHFFVAQKMLHEMYKTLVCVNYGFALGQWMVVNMTMLEDGAVVVSDLCEN